MSSKFIQAKSRAEALKAVGGDASTIIVKVNGGYMVFETVQDLKTWKNQK